MPAPALALPVVVTGGHALAHIPVHELLEPLSFEKRYRVRPLPSPSTLPSFVLMTSTFAVVELVAGVAAVRATAAPLLAIAATTPRATAGIVRLRRERFI